MNHLPAHETDGPGTALRRTCLHAQHMALGATLVPFHGWEMPLRYGPIPEEHLKVRLCAGLFDLCHMGRLEVSGPDAAEWLGRVITNDYDAMKPGAARYTLLCTEEGTILEDALVYRLEREAFLVVNASNRQKVIDWMEEARGGLDARLVDRTEDLAMVAIQGPQAARILPEAVEHLDGDWERMRYYSIADAHILGRVARIARTGYTGEDGFEVYLDSGLAPAFWEQVLELGGQRLAPIGLGARDTLRLEAGMPLHGNDIDTTTDPFEAGLDFAVKLDKPAPFIGREALRERRQRGPSRRLRGFRVLGRRVARQGMEIFLGGGAAPGPAAAATSAADSPASPALTSETLPEPTPSLQPDDAGAASPPAPAARPVGIITSGAPSPTLGYPIAMGYLDAALADRAQAGLVVDIRGNREPLQVEPLPFYSRTRRKER